MNDPLPLKPTLPEVDLRDLPEQTKNYLISLHAQTGQPIAELIRDILNRTARDHREGRAA